MNELLMFNPETLHQQYITPNKNDIDKLKERGWVENPKLVDMYHPSLSKHVMIPVQDVKMWEMKGYFAEPTMIYHPTEATKMVSSADAKKAIQNGWYLSPAHFPGNSEGKIKTLTLKEAS
jgi:hypothetical protein